MLQCIVRDARQCHQTYLTVFTQLCAPDRVHCYLGIARLRCAVWLHAGWLGAGASGSSDAASALAGSQRQVSKDTWRALEALLRLACSELTFRDDHLSPETFPETYYTLVRIYAAHFRHDSNCKLIRACRQRAVAGGSGSTREIGVNTRRGARG